MADLTRDIHLFISVARIEAALAANRQALQRLPQEIATLDKALADIDAAEKKSIADLEELLKKRRDVERQHKEHEEHLKKCKNQQSLVKTNAEYTAMLKEISNLEEAISQDESHILALMDGIETAQGETAVRSEKLKADRAQRSAEKAKLEAEAARVAAEVARLTAERPRVLAEISPPLLKRYERLSVHHRDIAVTRVEAEHCGACQQQLPPQIAVEVRKNDQFLTCPACGRILIHYAD